VTLREAKRVVLVDVASRYGRKALQLTYEQVVVGQEVAAWKKCLPIALLVCSLRSWGGGLHEACVVHV
jgi:hypothetical protein